MQFPFAKITWRQAKREWLYIYRKSRKAWTLARFPVHRASRTRDTHPHPSAWHLWCQRCQHWLKIYMGSPAGVTQESVAREGWMTNKKTAQGRSEWGLILGAVKNRKGRVKGKRLTESTVGRGRHTVRGKGTIFPVIFKHIYNTLLHMSGGIKNTGWDETLRACTARWGQRGGNFVWMLFYGQIS